MKIQHMDYTSSSTPALAKEAVALLECYQKAESLQSRYGRCEDTDYVYDYLLEAHNEVICELLDRFVDGFGFRAYYEANPDDWLDEEHFVSWYHAVAAQCQANEDMHRKNEWIQHWAENLGRKDVDNK